MKETALGPLVLVVGPSGAGKDSLIDGARRLLAGDPGFHFVRRVITRPVASGEDHDIWSESQFGEAERAGAFLLSWRANGLAYGIPASVQDWRRLGVTVVANASRAVVEDARARLAPIGVIAVTAPNDVLETRLRIRGRESGAEADARLARSAMALPDGPDVIQLINDRSLEAGIAAFLAALQKLRNHAI